MKACTARMMESPRRRRPSAMTERSESVRRRADPARRQGETGAPQEAAIGGADREIGAARHEVGQKPIEFASREGRHEKGAAAEIAVVLETAEQGAGILLGERRC